MNKPKGSRVSRKKVGLALGGGGARGLAHIGALKALQEAEIPVDCIAGTSVGSVIGTLLALGYDWQRMKHLAEQTKWSDLVGVSWPDKGLMQTKKLERFLEELTDSRSFDDLDAPFAVVGTDITNGEAVVLSHGPIAPAVRASCGVPGVFEPAEIGDRLLVDGGLVNEIPGDVVRELGADVVIAIDLNADRTRNKRPENIFDVLFYSMNILIAGTSQTGKTSADVTIEPDLHGFGYADLSRLDEAIGRGERAMREKLDEILTLVN